MAGTTRRSSKVVAVSVPPESAEDFERMARQEGRNKSELFREMLRVYRAYRESGRFESLQRYGRPGPGPLASATSETSSA